MKKKFLLLLLVSCYYTNSFSQCDITASASSINITCGESVDLTAFGSGSGTAILNENFNNGGYGAGWEASPGSTDFSNPCSPNGVDGTAHAWMGSNTAVPRTLTSQSYDLSTATNGVSICFDLLYATQGDNAPCEGPDLADEGITLQYSIDGGANWVDIHYFDPNGGTDPMLTNWNNWCFNLPAAAITSNTIIRWTQIVDSGAGYDHWGVDNVQIFKVDTDAEIIWLHDNYSYGVGNSGGVNPNPVTPTTTTTYTAQITTSTGQVCTNSVTVNVNIPTYEVNLTANPTTLCPGDCAKITGTAEIVIHAEEDLNYNTVDVISVTSAAAIAGFPPAIPATPGTIDASSDISIQNLYTNALNGSNINSICVDNFKFTDPGGILCIGNQTANINLIEIVLVAPNGTEVILAPIGSLSGTEINDMCFQLGAPAIATGTAPYTNTFAPANSWTGITGAANGTWKLVIRGTHTIGAIPGCLPQGELSGWSIDIKDPKVTQPVVAVWTPTSGVATPNSAITDICPATSENYNLYIGNGNAQCPSYTEDFPITVDLCNGCTPPTASATSPAPMCGSTSYDLNSAITVQAGSIVTFHSINTDAAGDINPLASSIVNASGNYYARVEDPTDPTCYRILPIGVTMYPLPVVNAGNDTSICSGGAVSLSASGAFSYTWDNGITNGVNFFPTATTVYTVTGTSADGCTDTDQVTVNMATNIVVDAGPDQTICQGDPVVLAGYGAGSYVWNNNVVDGQPFTPVSTTTYTVTGTSLTGGCTGTDNVTVTIVTPLVVDAGTDVTVCAGESVTLSASGGSNYTWDNGVIDGTAFIPTTTTTYNVTAGIGSCASTDQVTVTVNPNLTITSTNTPPTCGVADGGIDITVTAGSGNYSYNWNTGATTEDLSNINSGNYTVTVDDITSGCTNSYTVALNSANAPIITSIDAVDPSCSNDDGSILINTTGGVAPLEYSIDNGTTFITTNNFTNLSDGTYDIIVQDASLCQTFASQNLNAASGIVLDNIQPQMATCNQQNGGVTINVSNSTGTVTYTISSGTNTQNNSTGVFSGLGAGTYNLNVIDIAGCAINTTFDITTDLSATFDLSSTPPLCFGGNDGTITISNVAGGVAPYQYSINGGASQTALNFTGLRAGNYTVQTTGANGCTSTKTITITQPNQLTITNINTLNISCLADPCSGELNVSAPGAVSFQEIGSGTTNTTGNFNNLCAGTYGILVLDANGCSANGTATITIQTSPTAQFQTFPGILNLPENDIVTLNGSQNAEMYVWSVDGVIVDTTNNTSDFQYSFPYQAGNYQLCLIAFNQDLCSDTLCQNIQVIDDFIIYVPNTFTPDNDEFNQNFMPILSNIDIFNYQLQIFNRWGELIFESLDPRTGWDGSYNGQIVQEGVYTWKIKVKSPHFDEFKEFNGHLNLLR